MTSISSALSGIPISQLKQLDMSKLQATKLSPDMIERQQETFKSQFRVMASGKFDNDPSYVYGYVKVNGKTVATLYNSGASETSNAVGSQIKNLPSMGEGETLTGPALAQKRAADIAKQLGGTVEKASTAMTDAQWAARPPVTWAYDEKAMAAAQKEIDAQIAANKVFRDGAARTLFMAQDLAQEAA